MVIYLRWYWKRSSALFAYERLQRQPVEAGEDAVPGLALEVHDAADGAVVLPSGRLQVNAGDLRKKRLGHVSRFAVRFGSGLLLFSPVP